MDWFRMYHATLDNPKVQQLASELFKTWINLLCLASQTNGRKGTLPPERAIAFRLRLSLETVQEQIAVLIDIGLIDRANATTIAMHDWNDFQYISDSSTGRVHRHRAMKRFSNSQGNVARNVSETFKNRTESDSDSEQNRTEEKGGAGGRRRARSLAALADGSLAPSPESLDRQKQRLGISPDPGDDYRSPPRTKSDNVLGPRPVKSVSLSGEPQYE